MKNLLDDEWRKAERRFVEEKKLGFGHQPASKTSNSVFQKVYIAPFVARQTSPAVVSASDKLGSGEKGAETKRKAAWQRNRHWQDPEQASSDKAGTYLSGI